METSKLNNFDSAQESKPKILGIKEIQKQSFEMLEQINEKLDIKHLPDGMFLSLVEEVGEVARELSKKQKGYRGEFDKEKLGDELSDIITRVLVIAEDNNINLEEALINKFNKIKERFKI